LTGYTHYDMPQSRCPFHMWFYYGILNTILGQTPWWYTAKCTVCACARASAYLLVSSCTF
jgi:hypothetical protein